MTATSCPTRPTRPTRRDCLLAAPAWALAPLARAQRPGAAAAIAEDAARAAAASAHFPFGPVVPPRPMPAWPLTTHLGRSTTMRELALGRLTALQLMFAGCSATCPIQGAIFAQAQRQLGTGIAGLQFLSLSIDPLADTPKALAAWLQQFGAAPGWVAALPRMAERDALFELLGGPRPAGRSGPDPHTGQVYVLNRRGELVYRSADLPPPEQVVNALRQVDRLG